MQSRSSYEPAERIWLRSFFKWALFPQFEVAFWSALDMALSIRNRSIAVTWHLLGYWLMSWDIHLITVNCAWLTLRGIVNSHSVSPQVGSDKCEGRLAVFPSEKIDISIALLCSIMLERESMIISLQLCLQTRCNTIATCISRWSHL